MGSRFLIVLLLILIIPAASPAADVTGQSRTYLQARELSEDDTLIGLYEYLDLSVTGIGGDTGISLHAGGWGRVDLADERDDDATEGDLQYAHLTAHWAKLNTLIHLGRIYVMEGIASEQVDGAYVSTDLGYGFGASAYGGFAVEPGGESMYGGRVSHSVQDKYRLGVSYLFENYRDRDREEVGYDFALFPLAKASVQGRASYNLETDGWMEHLYYLHIGLVKGLKIRGEFSYADYGDLFHAASLSAFTFPVIDPEEKLTAYGVELEYAVTESFTVTVNYKLHDYDLGGEADCYGGTLNYSYGSQDGGAAVSYHRMDGETDRLKYHEVRAYVYRRWEKADLTADLIDVIYDEERNGVESVYSVSLAAGYRFTPAIKASADVEYLETPDFEEDVRGFLKLRYVFGASWGGV